MTYSPEKMTIRVHSYTKLRLDEMAKALDTQTSVLIRTLLMNYVNENEQEIDKIIEKQTVEYADN